MKGLFLISVELVIGARWKCSAHTRRCRSPLLCRDHLRSWSCSSPPDSCSLPSQKGLGSSCHNKTAAGSLRDTQDSYHAKLVLIGIPPPRERLLCAEIRKPLVTDRAWTLFTSSQTQLNHWGRRGMVWRLPEQQREWIMSEEAWAGVEGGGGCLQHPRSCGCPALCTPGMIPWERENSLIPQPHQHNFQGPSWSVFERRAENLTKICPQSRASYSSVNPVVAKSTKPRRVGFGASSPHVALKMLFSK